MTHHTLILPVHLFGIRDCCAEVFAVHLGNVIHGDTLRAGSLAFVKVCAVAEAFLVHLGDHGEHALLGFDPMTTVRARRIKKTLISAHSHLKVAMYTKQQVAKCPKVANTTRQYESLLAHSLRQEADMRVLGRYEQHCGCFPIMTAQV